MKFYGGVMGSTKKNWLNFGGDLGILRWVNEQKNNITVVAYPDRGVGNDPKIRLGVLRLIFPSARAGQRPVIGWKHFGGFSHFYRELTSGCITDLQGSDATWELRMTNGWTGGHTDRQVEEWGCMDWQTTSHGQTARLAIGWTDRPTDWRQANTEQTDWQTTEWTSGQTDGQMDDVDDEPQDCL